ncbi:MAG: right-handed parallel beta-helix repeat-containing protein [Deltaproteobacteria bacterium]|nr:right-handed parallel beta-helix repeat-containing protein [Deltaproteobacteria bacterium]
MRIAQLLGSLAALAALTSGALAAPAPGSQLIDCSQAGTRVDITVDSHLDPSCTWTRGVRILASNVTLDCQGARLYGPDRQRGIEISAPTTTALSNITVRNCQIEGFLNNIRVTRDGFRELAAGVEYDNGFSNIVIEDSTLLNSRGVGLFVDGYVTGVTMRRLHVEGSGSSGIYLEHGSKGSVVEDCDIVNNGFGENGPYWQEFDNTGLSGIWYWGSGREGISIDGARDSIVRNNHFSGNVYGAIFLYKNCGEYYLSRPERWWQRRYGADNNLIEGNTITGGTNGVWIAARMAENIVPMECSDPQYAPGYALDYADHNIIRDNIFQNVTYGVRVEDDDNQILDNQFSGAGAQQAVLIGTPLRTSVLGQPVTGTIVSGNSADIPANPNPYRWVHGHTNTTFSDNLSLGRPSGMCEGLEPARGPFVMTVAVVIQPTAPVDPPAGLTPPGPLGPCPLACDSGVTMSESAIRIARLDTPPGDDTLTFNGRLAIAHPFSPSFDPSLYGVGIVIADQAGTRVLDTTIAGGAYDPQTKVGWRVSSTGKRWKYVNKSSSPANGITAITIKDLSSRQPGLIDFRVQGKRGTYAVAPSAVTLTGTLVLDPPTAATGQCGAGTGVCVNDGRSLRCR